MLETDLALRSFRAGASEDERFHFGLARGLLRSLESLPRAHWAPFATRWHVVVATSFLTQGELGEASIVARDGARAFPQDGSLRLVAGMIAEAATLADAPDVVRGAGRRVVRVRNSNLSTAATAYRRALDMNRSLVQARLRLGRVLWLQNERTTARRELTRVLAEAADPNITYLGHLFLGHVLADEGDLAGARREYEAARRLGAGWPTPYVALAELADRAGRIDEAHELIDAMAGRESAAEEDPWETYLLGGGGQLQPAAAWLLAEISP